MRDRYDQSENASLAAVVWSDRRLSSCPVQVLAANPRKVRNLELTAARAARIYPAGMPHKDGKRDDRDHALLIG